jgi:N-glycosylase/DNA lyase
MEGYRSLEINEDSPFSLDNTLASGQAPRWENINGWWYGVVRDNVIKTRQEDGKVYFSGCSEKYYRNYFSLDYDLGKFYDSFSSDEYLKKAIETKHGLRLIRQDPWECLCFQMTINKKRNSPGMDCFTRISQKFGDEIELDGKIYFTFPTAERITEEGLSKLKTCNLGYKANNIYSAAKKVAEDPLWSKKIEFMTLEDAEEAVTKFRGIKPIVAEWVLIFAFRRYELFPVDSHMRGRMIKKYLSDVHFPKNSKTIDKYIQDYTRDYFGEHSAYALEYLFASRDSI